MTKGQMEALEKSNIFYLLYKKHQKSHPIFSNWCLIQYEKALNILFPQNKNLTDGSPKGV